MRVKAMSDVFVGTISMPNKVLVKLSMTLSVYWVARGR